MKQLIPEERIPVSNVYWALTRNNLLQANLYFPKGLETREYQTTTIDDILDGTIQIGDYLYRKRIGTQTKLISEPIEGVERQRIYPPANCPCCKTPLWRITRSDKNRIKSPFQKETIFTCVNYLGCHTNKLAQLDRFERIYGMGSLNLLPSIRRRLIKAKFYSTPFSLYQLKNQSRAVDFGHDSHLSYPEIRAIRQAAEKLPTHVSVVQLLFSMSYPLSLGKLTLLVKKYQSFDVIKRLTKAELLSIGKEGFMTEEEAEFIVNFWQQPHTRYNLNIIERHITVIPSEVVKEMVSNTKEQLVYLYGTARITDSFAHEHRQLQMIGILPVKNPDIAKAIFVADEKTKKVFQKKYPDKKVYLIQWTEVLRDVIKVYY